MASLKFSDAAGEALSQVLLMQEALQDDLL